MKKEFFKKSLYAMAAVCLTAGMISCEKNNGGSDDPQTKQEAELQKVITDYVDKSVVPTYKGLADASMELYTACVNMREAFKTNSLTEDLVKTADEAWIKARRYWELSEAWLFGAAADYNIDPHIDTWPLDQKMLQDMLDNDEQMAQMDEDGVYVGSALGQGLLGFHAVEYMIFQTSDDGKTAQPRAVDKYSTQEMNYLVAVAADLRNQCTRLEAAWAGSVSDDKQAILTETELDPTFDYGSSMKNAGKGGSLYINYNEAVQELIVGAQDIADEVGGQKIGNPVKGGTTEDQNYIESPYALNSIVDFKDNIVSIQNAYQGYQIGVNGNEADLYIQPVNYSLSAYIATVNRELDTKVKTTIQDAIDKIMLMKEPFKETARAEEFKQINQDAIDACTAIVDVLDELLNELTSM